MKTTGELKEKLSGEFLPRDAYVPRYLYKQAANATVANTVTQTTLFDTTNATGRVTLPANYLTVGRTIRLLATGTYDTAGSAVNMTLRFKIGTTFVNTGTNAMTTSQTGRAWKVDVVFTCRSTGASGSVQGEGFATIATSATAAAIWEMPSAAAFTVDTTAVQTLDLTAQWSAAVSGHSIVCRTVLIEVF